MSLRLRLSVLVLLISVLFMGTRAPLQANCDYDCDQLGFSPPYWTIYCWGLMCVFSSECETNCRIDGCWEDESGATVRLECFN